MHTTGHYGVANHEALRLAHINAESKDPPAGTIDRDAQSVPTGVLKEAAMDPVLKLIPDPTPEQLRNGILRMVDTLHREGMTAVKDPDIGQPTWDAYRQLRKRRSCRYTSVCYGTAEQRLHRRALLWLASRRSPGRPTP
jgi:predicted amidohydrolase YtcJ